MRPGQSCPGVVTWSVKSGGQLGGASMRPGQSCPGVVGAVPTADMTAGVDSFNEAGAIMPRSGVTWLTSIKVGSSPLQ